MTKTGDLWSVTLSKVAGGSYEYKFVLNGSNWIQDPGNPLTLDPTNKDSNNLLVLQETPAVTDNGDGTSTVVLRYAATSYTKGEVTSVEVMGGGLPGTTWDIGKSVKMVKSAKESNIYQAVFPKVQPGVYEYKFVINGSDWVQDPANPSTGNNSQLRVEGMPEFTSPEVNGRQVTFRYWAPSAGKVTLAGEMNNWEPTAADDLTKGDNGIWSITKTLDPGDYGYKFIVDGAWKNDQKNPDYMPNSDNNKVTVTAKEEEGGMPDFVSPEVKGTSVTFRFWDPDAQAVSLVGSMNGWSQTADPMTKGEKDIWSITKTLKPGTYEYKFYNGDDPWPADQKNPNKTQNGDSVVTVPDSVAEPEVNGRQVTFRYTNPNAGKVCLAGDMNGWDTDANPMTKDTDGQWTLTLTLGPAVYTYKFVVDGSWINDPLNNDRVDDNYGGYNNRFVVSGLSDEELVVQKGETAQLPATLALVSESGTSTNVTPTYALTKAVPGVDLDGTTLTVKSTCTATEFTVTATSGTYTSTITVHVVSNAYTYHVYFFDWDPNHMTLSGTDLWMWEVGGAPGHQERFTETEVINGHTWLKATLTSAATKIGLIPRSYNAWTWQTPDHFFENTEKKAECNVYIVNGDDNTYGEVPELPDVQGRNFYVPGTFPGPSWAAGSNKMTLWNEENQIYSYTFKNVPAGNYEFKITVNAAWSENYGIGGVADGGNYSVSVPKAQDVTVYYSDVSHLAVTSVNYDFLTVRLEGEGIPADTYLTDAGLTGIYSQKVSLAAGTYSGLHLVVEGDDTQRVFTDFTLDTGKDVTFYYAPAYDLYYHDALPSNEAAWETVYFNSKESAYKSVYGAVATNQSVTFALDAGTDITGATLVIGKNTYPMAAGEEAKGIRTWTVTVSDLDTIGEYDYFFVVSQASAIKVYCDDNGYYGPGKVADLTAVTPYDLVVYRAGYETPDWMKDAVIYQIFPDRFFNGDTSNDRNQTTARGPVNYEFPDWDQLPENPEWTNDPNYPENAFKGDGEWSNEIYGGDLKGITEKIGYLKKLGVTVIYLNPVFASISSHRYDTSDYTKIDPILGDLGDFTELVKVAEENGMHIVLDGVFNHVSDDSIYFDRYYKYLNTEGCTAVGAYPYWAWVYDYMDAHPNATQPEAEAAARSYFQGRGITDFSYTTWFDVFQRPMEGAVDKIGERIGKPVYDYDGWWGYDSMPIIKATGGSEYQTEDWAKKIIDGSGSVTQYWLTQGSDGWRLDVANEVSDETWQHFRESVKATQSDAVIIGEIWDDATKYLMGDMYDSVMNYVFRDTVLSYAKGGSSQDAMADLERLRERYPQEAFYAMMNLVGSHDTARVLSFLDGIPDGRDNATLDIAFPTYETTSDLAKQRQYLVAFLQFTYAGAPTIYYGDERGMVGTDDPDDRRTIDWSKVNDENLLAWYTQLAAIRNSHSALRTGSVEPIADTTGKILGYVRRDGTGPMIVLANNDKQPQSVTLDLADLRAEALYVEELLGGKTYVPEEGKITVEVPALSGVILAAGQPGKATVQVTLGEGVPEITLADPEALLEALMTPEEKAQLALGVDVTLTLTVEDISDTVDSQTKGTAEKAAGKGTVGMYLTFTLTKQVGQTQTNIPSLEKPISLTMQLPKELQKTDRSFALIYVKGDQVTGHQDLDEDAATYTWETGSFGTYALLYRDPEVTPPTEPEPTVTEPSEKPTDPSSVPPTGEGAEKPPKTGDETDLIFLSAMTLLSLGGAAALALAWREEKRRRS